jgi:acetyl-CoA acetyltransferase
MDSLKDRTAIVGVGWTKFSRNSGVSVLSLAVEACKKAIDDAGLSVKEIDGVVTHNMGDSVMSQEVATCLGLPNMGYHLEYWGGGPAGCQVVINAAMAVATGMARHVVCFRALNGRSGCRLGGTGERPPSTGEAQFLIPYGWTSFVHAFANMARRHMIEYGTTSRQMGLVAVAERRHASMNPRAMMRTPITLDDYFASKMMVDPFRLLDICLETDGGCAVVVTSAERAKHLRHRPVYIMGAAIGSGPDPTPYGLHTFGWLRGSHTVLYGKHISPQLYRMAGIAPKDIDVAELYDEMTIAVLVQLEDFGFCNKGEGGPFVEEGHIEIGRELPVNTHGGFLSEGYLHGLNHIAEAVSQLRGDAGPRQVEDAEIALCTSLGMQAGSALILRR